MLVAVGVSIAEFLVRVARPHDAILETVPGMAGMHDIDDYPQTRTIPGLVVYRYDARLFFASAQDFRRRTLAAARSGGPDRPARWFVFNVEANVEVDLTALEALDRVRDELARDGTILALARVKQDLLVLGRHPPAAASQNPDGKNSGTVAGADSKAPPRTRPATAFRS